MVILGCRNTARTGSSLDPDQPIAITFLSDAAEPTMPEEERAALEWLQAQPGFATEFVQLSDLATARPDPGSVLWWHHADSAALPTSAMQQPAIDAVRAHLRGGGALMLSLFAATWVVPLELEAHPPDDVGLRLGADWARWTPDDERLLTGLQSYRGHPLLRRFWGGVYTGVLHRDKRYASVRWSGDNWPLDGAVVAVGKRYIGFNPEHRVIVEYAAGDGRAGPVLVIGEGLYFADRDNRNRMQLELFARDALVYISGDQPPAPPGAAIASTGAVALPALRTMAAGDGDAPPPPPGGSDLPPVSPEPTAEELPGVLGATTYWTPRQAGSRWFEASSEESATELRADVVEAVSAARSGLALEQEVADNAPFDLYSPRALVVGTRNGRIDELWGYPLRMLRDLRFGFSRDASRQGTAQIRWLDTAAQSITFTIRPEGASFRYAFDDLTIVAHLAVPRDRPGLVALFEVESDTPVVMHARWRSDHASMWPREPRHLGPIELGWDAGVAAVVWRDPTASFTAYAGFSAPASSVTIGGRQLDVSTAEALEATAPPSQGESANQLENARVSLQVTHDPTLEPGVAFVVASAFDDSTARNSYLELLGDPAATWTANANHYRQFLAESLSIASPDPTFNEAFRWATVGLDAFRVTTPGMGTGLVAGYAASADPTAAAWHRDNDFLRRPGYAWYFGRDAVWTAFAADAYGGTDLTAEALRFLARYQDVDGKIAHQISPGWAIHYDAADSTPLFLLGLDHHIRATGDRELLRQLWPSVRRAMRFLESTDTDGDGLIENTAVGHGWIEEGAIYGAHTTFYLASLWVAALQAVERMAVWMVDDELTALSQQRRASAEATLEEGFWDPQARTYFYGLRADGAYQSAPTILPAVPMYFGLLDAAKVRPLLERFASSDITSDWGARLIERSSPAYDPNGYHQGMVWPLFSGWTSLAAYAHGRPLAGYLNLNQNLRLVRQGNLGHIPEALHGETYELAGETTHQATSHAMAVLPAVEGMLGIRPDALQGRLRIYPHLPGGWTETTVQPVKVGAESFRVAIFRAPESSGFTIDRLAGSDPIQLELALPFPRDVLVNLDPDNTTGVVIAGGLSVIDHPHEKEARVTVTLTEPQATVVFRHSPYPEVVQPLPAPEPGATSTGLLVLESVLVGGALQLRVEGIPGRRYRVEIATPWPVRSVEGIAATSVIVGGPGRAVLELMLPGATENYQRAAVTVYFTQ